MRYFISAAVLLLVTLLFIRSVLPRSGASMSLARETDLKTLEFRLRVLSMNCSDCSKRGGGLNVRTPLREIRHFFKAAEKRIRSGERLEDFERSIYSARSRIEEALTLVEKEAPQFFRLPHHGKYPRLYEMCALMTCSNGGYADETAVKTAIDIFNEHSPLLFSEMRALKAMLAFCVSEQIAALAVKSRVMRKKTVKAEKDALGERIDLTMLKYNTYVYAYSEHMDGSVARKFSSICLENGVDVSGRKTEYIEKCGRYASLAYAAVQSLKEIPQWLTLDWSLKNYVAYPSFVSACGESLEKLSPEERAALINAFAVYCRKKRKDEITEAKKANKEAVCSAADKALPSPLLLGLLLVLSVIAGVLPTAIALAFLPIATLPMSLLSLPVFMFASISALKSMLDMSFDRLLPSQRLYAKTPANAEFSSDFVFATDMQREEHADEAIGSQTVSSRLDVFLKTLENIASAVGLVVPLCSLALVLIAPFYSALWLLAAFSSEIVAFMLCLRAALIEEDAVFSRIFSVTVTAFDLPFRALKSIYGLKKFCGLKGVAVGARAIAAAALILISALTGANAVFYFVAAAFLIVPAFAYVYKKYERRRRIRKTNDLKCENEQSVYDNIGVYPRVRFLLCGNYTSIVTDGKHSRDSFLGRNILRNMRIFVITDNGREPLRFSPPLVCEHGRIILNAAAANRTFAVELSACEGGKCVTVKPHGGGDFTFVCVHEPVNGLQKASEERSMSECDVDLFAENSGTAPVFIAVASPKSANMSVTADTSEFLYGIDNGDGRLLAVTVNTVDGEAKTVFAAGCDEAELKSRISCAFKNGYLQRYRAKSAATARLYKFNTSLYDKAAFIMFGRCLYKDKDLTKYIDIKFNTILYYHRNGGNLAKLYSKLKSLAVLKQLGLGFNVAVLCYDEAMRFRVTENKISLLFEEFGLNRNGKAVCIDCEKDTQICESLKAVAPDADSLRFKARVAQPPVRSFRRACCELGMDNLICESSAGGITPGGDGVYCGFGISAAAENKLANADGFGCVIRADGSGFTFDSNAAVNKFTEDIGILDGMPSEFVLFSEGGRVWSASMLPLGVKDEVYCCHEKDRTVFACSTNGLKIEQSVGIAQNMGAKIWDIMLFNPRKTKRKLTVLICARPVLGRSGSDTRGILELLETEHGAAAENVVTGRKMYIETDAEKFSRSLALEPILGEAGEICRITDLSHGGEIPALILSTEISLPPQSEKKIRFSLSDTPIFSSDPSLKLETGVRSSALSLVTGKRELDIFLSRLYFQTRAALLCPQYESVGQSADSYAAPLICASALLPDETDSVRRAIVDACRRRFINGDILLFNADGTGTRAERAASSLFLPLAVARYADCTDDRDILYERVPYTESDAEGNCHISDRRAPVLEHCIRVFYRSANNETEDCFGIDSRLILYTAIEKFLPLVKDTRTRFELAEIKTSLDTWAESLDCDGMNKQSIAWLAIIGYSKGISDSSLVAAANEEGTDTVTKLWLCAALLKRGNADAAFELFESLDPVSANIGICALPDGKLPRPSCGIDAAVAEIIVREGFFGCNIRGGCIVLSPRLPKTVRHASLTYDRDNIKFTVRINNEGSGNWRICENGIAYNANSFEISDKLNGRSPELKRG